MKAIKVKRGTPHEAGALVSVEQAAAMAGLHPLAYRRNILLAPGHPAPVGVGRPALFRRVEIVDFLGVQNQNAIA